MKKINNYSPQLPEKEINKLVKELSDPKISPISYSHYQKTEEWIIVEKLLKKLKSNKDIEIKTPLKNVVGYMVKELRNKDLSLLSKENSSHKSNIRIKKHA
ncbi:MAG: hypothetical protein GBAus27B_000202 [Mycoplasmataceae bacterium]|nr:MAG: hypothetical protein GBAus27B_000202 [Mycoplasmataceae bacterium]